FHPPIGAAVSRRAVIFHRLRPFRLRKPPAAFTVSPCRCPALKFDTSSLCAIPGLADIAFGRFVTYKTIIALSFKPSFLTVKVKAV
ncbi:hypothetical protein, partial [Neisseria gonorrhoeae]|uniref:hypothetical protein n=7 Tax=Neisseria gonorrhoeae TaxID=485 RepID=UPI001B7FDD96